MKKIFALILSLMLILCLSACSEEPAEEPVSEPVEEPASAAEEPEEEPETEEPEPEPEGFPEVDIENCLGEIIDGTYYHYGAGISVKIPDGWYSYPKEELLAGSDFELGYAEELILEDEFYNTILVSVRTISRFKNRDEVIEFIDREWFSQEDIFLENKETGYLDIKDIFYSKHTYGGAVSTLANTYIVFCEGYIIEIDCILSHNSTMEQIESNINFNIEES